jgi:hypothetical protein
LSGDARQHGTTLPVPIEFQLPNGTWRPVDPEAVGVTNAAFLAMRASEPGEYTPTISISGDWRLDDASLEQIADEALEGARSEGLGVDLIKRDEAGSPQAPALTQLVDLDATVDGRQYDLRRGQVFSAFLDQGDPSKRVVVVFTFTCTYRQFRDFGREFQEFMGSVAPARGNGQG